MDKKETLESIYHSSCNDGCNMHMHAPRLRKLAEGLEHVCEIGVEHARSSSAFLMAGVKLTSVDLRPRKRAYRLQKIVGDRWTLLIENSLKFAMPECDLLFIDSRHTYAQVKRELELSGGNAKRYLVFHDTITFGTKGEDKGPGIRPAIDEFMAAHPEWIIKEHYTDCHGLLVLEKCSQSVS